MSKKRLIFTLLYNDGGFMLSRNFRLQRAGGIEWLKNNYNFKNTAFFKLPSLVKDLIRLYGAQCIIASVDVKKDADSFHIYIENGSIKVPFGLSEGIKRIIDIGVGEIYLNSMD